MEELKEEVPSLIHFDIGYYEKRTSMCWLVNAGLMYETLKSDDISLWCDAETADDRRSDGKNREQSGGTS